MSKSEIVSHCSVSENFITYAIVPKIDEHLENMFTVDSAESASQTVIYIINLKEMREIKIPNPSPDKVTALYIDNDIMMIGSRAKTFEVKPMALFLNNLKSP